MRNLMVSHSLEISSVSSADHCPVPGSYSLPEVKEDIPVIDLTGTVTDDESTLKQLEEGMDITDVDDQASHTGLDQIGVMLQDIINEIKVGNADVTDALPELLEKQAEEVRLSIIRQFVLGVRDEMDKLIIFRTSLEEDKVRLDKTIASVNERLAQRQQILEDFGIEYNIV
ncbi:MAG: hypothetical protein ACRYGR_01895 [Janthinobacterium lividum]